MADSFIVNKLKDTKNEHTERFHSFEKPGLFPDRTLILYKTLFPSMLNLI